MRFSQSTMFKAEKDTHPIVSKNKYSVYGHEWSQK